MKKDVAWDCRFEEIQFNFSVDSIMKILENAVEMMMTMKRPLPTIRKEAWYKNGGKLYISP